MSGIIVFKREELYELVWSEPITKIGKKFGISDVAIAKKCRQLDVPRPPRGYWARLAHGYKDSKPPLPKLKKGVATTCEINPTYHSNQPRLKPKKETPSVTVKEKVTRYHPTVVEIRQILAEGREDDYHRISTGPSIRVLVSKNTLPRVCRILDALLREFDKRGFKSSVEVQRYQGKRLIVRVAQEKIGFEILEPAIRHAEKSVNKWGYESWDYTPTGKLKLSLWSRYLDGYQTNWSDTPHKRLEERLGNIVALFEDLPNIIRSKKEEERLEKLAEQRRALNRRRRNDIIMLTKKRAEHVDQLVRDLDQARSIRAWVRDVEHSETPPVSTKRLARWAAHYANHLDPLVDFRLIHLDTEIQPNRAWLR
ncbi:hypothetical protein ACFL00_02090 [Pseudomonadota bacterium]